MKFVCSVEMKAELIHTRTGKPIILEFSKKQTLEEETQEFKDFCDSLKQEKQIEEFESKEKLYEAVGKFLLEESKEEEKGTLQIITQTIKEYYSCKRDMVGCQITFAGTTVDMSEFCTFSIKEFHIKVNKED